MDTDAALLAHYTQRRDGEAFARLVERHAAMVYATCRRHSCTRADAEDAAQECFIELARQAGRVRSSVPAWLHTVAMRLAVSRRSRIVAAAPIEVADEVAKAEPAEPVWGELAGRIDAELEALPQGLREVLVARFLDGQGQAEIARGLGINQGTVSRRIEEGLRILRKRLGVGATDGAFTGALGALMMPPPAGVQAKLMHLAMVGPTPLPATPVLSRTMLWAAALAVPIGVVAWLAWPHAQPINPAADAAAAADAAHSATAAAPAPATSPAEQALGTVIAVDYRRESVRSVCTDLDLRVGRRLGVRIACPTVLAGLGPLTVQSGAISLRDLLAQASVGTGLTLQSGTRTLTLVRRDKDDDLAQLVATVQGKLPNDGTLTPDGAADQRADAACALGDLGDDRVWPALLGALGDADAGVRVAALDALRRQVPAVPETIDHQAVAAAITAAIRLNAPSAAADATPLDEESRWETLALAEIAGACGLPRPDGDDAEIAMRWRGAAAAAVPQPPAADLLDQLDHLSATAVAVALGARAPGADDAATLALIDRAHDALLASGGDAATWVRTRWMARRWMDGTELPAEERRAIALGLACRAGASDLEPRLAALADDRDPLVRARAALALGYARDPRGLAALGRLADTRHDRETRRIALWSLGFLRGADTLPALMVAVGDAAESIPAWAAITTTGATGAQDRLQPLAAAMGGVPRRAADYALSQLGLDTPTESRIDAWQGERELPARALSCSGFTREVLADVVAGTKSGLMQDQRNLDVALRTITAPVAERRAALAHMVATWNDHFENARDAGPGHGTPASAPAPATVTCRWNNGRASTIAIGGGTGTVHTAVVTTHEGDGRLIVSYLASAFCTADGVIQVDGYGGLLSGPRSGDWAPESFAIGGDGHVEVMDAQGAGIAAQVEVPPVPATASAAATAAKAADF